MSEADSIEEAKSPEKIPSDVINAVELLLNGKRNGLHWIMLGASVQRAQFLTCRFVA